MHIKAVIFDMDGLMIDSEPLAKEAWRILLGEYGYSLDQETTQSILGLRLLDTAHLIKSKYDLPLNTREIADRRLELMLTLIPGNLEAMPGLQKLLEAVDARGLRRAVATSSPDAYAPVALREVAVADGFETIITGDMVARGKPAPDIYLAAAEALSLSPKVCLALEDSLNGVRAAKTAGMRCVAVPNVYSSVQDLAVADWEMPSLATVAERLDELLR